MGFDESKVRRGQPANAGQFAPRPGGQVSDDQTERLRGLAAEDGEFWIVDDEGSDVAGPYDSPHQALDGGREHAHEAPGSDLHVLGPEGLTGDHLERGLTLTDEPGGRAQASSRRRVVRPGVVRPNAGERPMAELAAMSAAELHDATGVDADATWSVEVGPPRGPRVQVFQEDGPTAIAAASYLAEVRPEEHVWVSVSEETGTRWVASGSPATRLRWSPAGVDGPPTAAAAADVKAGDCVFLAETGFGYPVAAATVLDEGRVRIDYETGGCSFHSADEHVPVLVDRIDRGTQPPDKPAG